MIFYKMYPYSVKATLCSALFSVIALLLAGLAFLCFSNADGIILKILGTVVCTAGAVFSFVYMSRTLPDSIAEKDFKKKITTNAKFAYNYCRQNPQHFQTVAAENPDFARKYDMDENGKIVKR